MKRCLFALSIGLFGWMIYGCTVNQDPSLEFVGADLNLVRTDDLGRAINLASADRQYDYSEFVANVRGSLNRWINRSENEISAIPWSLAPEFESLISNIEDTAAIESMDRLDFIDTDVYYLQNLAWLKRVTERIQVPALKLFELQRLAADNFLPDEQSPNPVADIFKKLHPDLNPQQAIELMQAANLFDWIVLNLQLVPSNNVSPDNFEELRLNDKSEPAAAGIAGPGYQRFSHQALLLGRADYVEKSKLFIEGLRIQGIDAIMLGVKDSTSNELAEAAAWQPWVVAVLIGDQYYLFDFRLGLPIPGETTGSIATLNQVQTNPQLLTRLDLTIEESLQENTQYWVRPEQLQPLVGWLYITPESVSRRFKILEDSIIDQSDRLNSFVDVSALRQRLPTLEGVDYQIWDLAIKTHQYRQALREALEDRGNNVIGERLRDYFENEFYIDEFPRYRTSRVRFLYGLYETEKDAVRFTAIEAFDSLLYTDEVIDNLAADPVLHERLGILPSIKKDSAEFNRRLATVQGHMRLVRRDAGLFMAQCHIDNGTFTAAANWLRLLKQDSKFSRWQESIIYLSGRAAESQRDFDEAISNYRANLNLLQSHGNVIRARLLQAAIVNVYGATSIEVDQQPESDHGSDDIDRDPAKDVDNATNIDASIER